MNPTWHRAVAVAAALTGQASIRDVILFPQMRAE